MFRLRMWCAIAILAYRGRRIGLDCGSWFRFFETKFQDLKLSFEKQVSDKTGFGKAGFTKLSLFFESWFRKKSVSKPAFETNLISWNLKSWFRKASFRQNRFRESGFHETQFVFRKLVSKKTSFESSFRNLSGFLKPEILSFELFRNSETKFRNIITDFETKFLKTKRVSKLSFEINLGFETQKVGFTKLGSSLET